MIFRLNSSVHLSLSSQNIDVYPQRGWRKGEIEGGTRDKYCICTQHAGSMHTDSRANREAGSMMWSFVLKKKHTSWTLLSLLSLCYSERRYPGRQVSQPPAHHSSVIVPSTSENQSSFDTSSFESQHCRQRRRIKASVDSTGQSHLSSRACSCLAVWKKCIFP